MFSQLYLPDVVVSAGVLGLLPREGTRILFLDVAFFCLSDVLGLRESPRDHQGGKKKNEYSIAMVRYRAAQFRCIQ